MPRQLTYKTYAIGSGGGNESFDVSESVDVYLIAPASPVTIGADMNFSASGTPEEGMQFNIIYGGDVTSDTSGGKTVNFFGVDITDEQALTQNIITATYTNGAWSVGVVSYSIFSQPSIWGSQIKDGTLGANAFPNGKMPISKIADLPSAGYIIVAGGGGVITSLDASGSGYLLIGTGSGLSSVPSSGDILVDNTGLFSIQPGVVLTDMLANLSVTADKLSANLQLTQQIVDVSFESGEQGNNTILMSGKGTILNSYYVVKKAIAATDDATLTLKNNAGTTMTGSPITIPASSAVNYAASTSITANNTFVDGDVIQLVGAKTTAGGKIQVTLRIQYTA